MTRRLTLLLLVFVFLVNPVTSQESESELNPKRLKIVVGSTVAAYSITLIGLNELWYSDFPRQSFHFFDDNSEWKQVDKIGHLYSAFHLSDFTSSWYQWAGLKQRKAYFWGSVTGFLLLTPIEILDGHSAEFGASYGDILANTAGSMLFLGQTLLWDEIRITPKFSFSRTDYPPLRPETLGSSLREEILKDYNGQTYWLSFNIYSFLKDDSNFPKWLNLSVGYGAQDMIFARDGANISAGFDPYRQYYLAPDIDLTRIPTKRKGIKAALRILNLFHIPGPALEFSRGGMKAKLLFF